MTTFCAAGLGRLLAESSHELRSGDRAMVKERNDGRRLHPRYVRPGDSSQMATPTRQLDSTVVGQRTATYPGTQTASHYPCTYSKNHARSKMASHLPSDSATKVEFCLAKPLVKQPTSVKSQS